MRKRIEKSYCTPSQRKTKFVSFHPRRLTIKTNLTIFLLRPSLLEHKDAAMVERLLRLGANPNAKTQDGIPALIAAMHMGDQSLMPATGFDPNVEITTLLLDHGASPEALNKNWQTPLMAAACFGDEKLIELFIDHKANVNIGNRFGMTALMYASVVSPKRLELFFPPFS